MRRNNSLPLTVTVIVVALLAIFVGYLIGNWLIQIVIGNPENQTEMAGKKIIKEEIIRDEPEENNNETLSSDINTNKKETNLNNNKNEEKDELETKEFIVNDKNSSKDVFVVQVGAFNKYNNALSLKNELESKGFQVIITEGIPYKVQLGASTQREETEEIEEEIEALGYNAFITH